jgi:hypothetical protein
MLYLCVRYTISVSAPSHVSIQHPALDGEAPFSQVLPGVPSLDRGPADAELLQTGTQGEKHPRIVADDGVRYVALRNRLAADLHHPGEVLAIKAPGLHKGPALAIEQQNTIEPVSLDLNEVAHINEPDLIGRHGGRETIVGIRRELRRRRGGCACL